MRLLRILFVAALCACALGAGAAGAEGGHVDSYAAAMKVPGHDVTASLTAISTVEAKSLRFPIPPTASRDAAAALTKVCAELRQATIKLQAIKPPAAVAGKHALLLAGAKKLRAELLPLIPKFEKGQYSLVATLSSLPGVTELSGGLAGLRKQGYPLR